MKNLLLKLNAFRGKLSFNDFKNVCALYEKTGKEVYRRIIRSFFKNCHLGKDKYDFFSVFTPKIWEEYVATYISDRIKIDDDIWLKMDISLWKKERFHFNNEKKIIQCSDVEKRDYYLKNIQLSNLGVMYLFDTFLKEKSGNTILLYFSNPHLFLFLSQELKKYFISQRPDLYLEIILSYYENKLIPLDFARLLSLVNNTKVVRTILCKTIVPSNAFEDGIIIQKHCCYSEVAVAWIMNIFYCKSKEDYVNYPIPKIELTQEEKNFLYYKLQGEVMYQKEILSDKNFTVIESGKFFRIIRDFMDTHVVSMRFYAEIIYRYPEMKEIVLMYLKHYITSKKFKKMPMFLKQKVLMIIDYALVEIKNK